MSVVDEIKGRLDIVDVVSGYVALQKAGRNFKAACPFHTEKTPSFVVNPERQSWRCFGACATGGDAFSFVMRIERMDFADALRLLAHKTGVTLHERREGSRSDKLYLLNQEAARYYQNVLSSAEGQRGRAYLVERGVDASACTSFLLGMSSTGRDGLRGHLRGLGFELDDAVVAGLLRRGEDGSVRDFFWGRLMFPIHDRQGRVAGFGARSLDGSDPKYINTPSSPIFDKRSMLYGIHKAAGPIRESGAAIIVEGYMDVIAAHQFGYANVVASMGTALTERQVAQLKSMAAEYVLALDPDAAGQEATLRSLEASWKVFDRHQLGARHRILGPLFQRQTLNLKIAALPRGRDPDQLIRQDAARWERLTQEAVPFMEFIIPAVASKYDLSSDRGRGQAAEVLAPMMAAIGNAVEQDHYFDLVAKVLGVPRQALEASIGSPTFARQARSRRPARRDTHEGATVSALSGDGRDALEDYILALLLKLPHLRQRARAQASEQFQRTESREVFTLLLGCSTIDEFRESLDESLHEYLDYLDGKDLAHVDARSAEAALGQALRRLEQRYLQELQEGLLATEDAALPPPRDLEEAIVTVNVRLKEIFAHQD